MILRQQRLAVVLIGALLVLAACTGASEPTADDEESVVLSLSNAGGEALQCRILFGHWVEQDLGQLAAGSTRDIALRRQHSDGGLFLPRASDGRRMMIENLVCGPLQDWWERRADVPLLPLRASTARQFGTTCAVTDRARCSEPAAP